MTDRWRTDVWNQHDGWPIHTVQCTICGEQRRAFPPRLHMLGNWKTDHVTKCPDLEPPRCSAVLNPDALPVRRCLLAAGHPEGVEYTWFTDWLGHIWEVP